MRSRLLPWAVLSVLGGLVAGCADDRALSATGSASAAPSAPPLPPVVMFIGDSYAAGWGPVPQEDAYASETAKRLNWQIIIAAHGGIGYVAPGRVKKSFQRVFDRELAWRPAPDLVVISGGHNDRGWSPARVEAAAHRLVDDIKETWRKTAITMVGPMWGGDSPPAGKEISRRLARVASRQKVAYVDPVKDQWMTDEKAGKFILPDGTHPTGEGHGYLADRLIEGLRRTNLDKRLLGG